MDIKARIMCVIYYSISQYIYALASKGTDKCIQKDHNWKTNIYVISEKISHDNVLTSILHVK